MRGYKTILMGALLVAWSHAPAAAQEAETDLAFIESCRAERNCVCDGLDDWFACVADAPRLVERASFDPAPLVASIVSEANRHLARECAPGVRGSRHRLCDATVVLLDLASGEDPVAQFLAAELHGEPQLDAPNDQWRAFLEGSLEDGGEIGPPLPGTGGGGGIIVGGGLGQAGPSLSAPGTPPPPRTGGTRVAAGDAMRRGGSPQTAGGLPASAADRMCRALPAGGGGNPSYAQCVPPLCQCPPDPKVNVVVGGATIEFSPTMVCETVSQGLPDLLEKVAHVPGATAQMLSILGMAAQVLNAIAENAIPILCGYARNQVYYSDECINDYSKAECDGARLALACLGCGESGSKECNARCLCFWQALANYNEDRRRREGRWCRNFGIRCPDERGYFYRLGMSCLNPPPGGLRGGGYR